jgi:hypothetical protein
VGEVVGVGVGVGVGEEVGVDGDGEEEAVVGINGGVVGKGKEGEEAVEALTTTGCIGREFSVTRTTSSESLHNAREKEGVKA